MNILMVTDLYPVEGTTDPSVHALHRFCRHWSRRNRIRILMPRILPDWRGRQDGGGGAWEIEGVQVVSAPVLKFPFRPWFCVKAMEREVRWNHPQVVVGHLGFNLDIAARLASRNDLPLIAAVHMGDLVYGPRMLGAERLREIMFQARVVAPRSPAVRRRLLARFPDLRSRCRTVWSGLDTQGYLRGSAEPRLRELARGGILRLITACSLVKLKKVDITLKALARIGGSRSWLFTIAGDGPERSRLEELARDLGIEDRVRFTGKLSRASLREELARAHLFVMVSAPETFGLAFLEAMGAGCLVAGARENGVDGVIVNRRNGWLCRPDDADALADLFREVLSAREDTLLEIAENSRRTVSMLTEEKAAANYLEIIGRAVSRRGESV